jgi:hypothetical protein
VPYRLYQLAETPTMAATWRNRDGTATIYISDDPSANEITLTIVNDLEAPIIFPPGSPAAIGALPPGQCAIYLFLNGLLSNEQAGAISAQAPWASAVFTDPATGQAYLAMAPGEQIVLNVGEAVALRLAGVTASGQPTSGYVNMFLFGVRGVEDGTGMQAYITLTHPPAPGDKELRLLAGFAEGDMVFTGTGHHNRLLLFLSNPGPKPLVPGGSDSWGPNPPVFRFSLTCGTGPGALTTVDLARQIGFSIDNAYGNVWRHPERDDQGDHPRWLLRPDRNGGGTVLGTGAQATIVFDIENIVTTLPQGVTYAHIGYQNIPGYDDGYLALEIIKVEPIVIESFTATPAEIANAIAGSEVTLRFAVRNAAYITILNTPYARPANRLRTEDSMVTTIAATTTFTLLAQNLATGQQYAQALTVPVSPDPFHILPVGTVLLWSGPADAIPAGWALCDGKDGRPDLLNRFALGAGPRGSSAPSPGDRGGAGSHAHDASAHVGIALSGEHFHHLPTDWYDRTVPSEGRKPVNVIDRGSGSVKNQTTGMSPTHSHAAAANVIVKPADALPPWSGLCYIVKTGKA